MAKTATASAAPPRWRSIAIAALVALALAILAVWALFNAEKQWKGWEFPEGVDPGTHPTVFPYLASSVVFFASCVWVAMEGHATLVAAAGRSPILLRPWSAIVAVLSFTALCIFLAGWGMAGPEAIESVRHLNCYLFSSSLKACARIEQLDQYLNYITAAANATAIGVVVYLGMKCFELTLAARKWRQRQINLRDCFRALSELLTLASTVLVTATLSLFLLFIAAAEIKGVPALESSKTHRQVEASTESDAKAPKGRKNATVIRCNGAVTSAPFECELETNSAAAKPMAPSMAFVAGLSFTAALFFLFMTAGSALEDVVQEEVNIARAGEIGKTPAFSVKTWLEQEGLNESARDVVLRTLALVAPAATGAITFLAT